MRSKHPDETRRRLMAGAGATGLLAGMNGLLPAWARPIGGAVGARRPGPSEYDIRIARTRIPIAGREAYAHTLNGTVPGPLIELHEGHEARAAGAQHARRAHLHSLARPPAAVRAWTACRA